MNKDMRTIVPKCACGRNLNMKEQVKAKKTKIEKIIPKET